MATVASQSRPAASVPWRLTRDEYYRLGETGIFGDRRTELLRGEVYIVSPPLWPHSSAVAGVGDALRPVFAGLGWVNIQSPLRAAGSEPEPDVAIIPAPAAATPTTPKRHSWLSKSRDRA